MNKGLLIAFVLLLVPAPAFAGLYRVMSFDRGSVTVEFTIPAPIVRAAEGEGKDSLSAVSVPGFACLDREGAPLLPARRFLFEVPAADGVTMEILGEESSFIEGVLPRVYLEKGSFADERRALASAPPLAEQRFARLSGVGTFRTRHLAYVDMTPVLFDPEGRRLSCARRVVIRLSFPQAVAGQGAASPFYADLAVNSNQASSWKRPAEAAPAAARTPFEFALSDNWVKITVRDKGIYFITYDALMSAGVDPSTVDPATMRLFAGGANQQPDSIEQGGSFLDSYHLAEQAMFVRGGSTGEFSPGDTIFFYGLGVNGWAKDYDPSNDARTYRRHIYATTNVYWLTWGGTFSGAPRRMGQRDVSPAGGADTVITSYEERIHREEDQLYDPIYADGRWFWLLLGSGIPTFTDDFQCTDIASPNGVLKTLGYGPRSVTQPSHTARYYINEALAGSLTWTVVPYRYYPAGMKTLIAPVANLVSGRNVFRISKAIDDEAYLFWYEIFYQRQLKASLGAFDFFAPVRPLKGSFTLEAFPQGERLLFNVTYPSSPVLCTGWQPAAGSIVFADSLGGYAHHYIAVSRTALKRPPLEFRRVPSLRDEAGCPDMVIVYHARFQEAALMLKGLHERMLPGVANPVVKAVDIEDVYDNFSGGLKDPIAIRNYLKFLYDKGGCGTGGEPSLKYVLLIGNGTYDPRDVLHQGNDFVPLYINILFVNESEGIEDEDYFVKLDGSRNRVPDRVPDLAIGRMTVLTDREATAWAQRIIDYEERPDFGAWRDKVILVADDEHSTSSDIDFDFLKDTETIALRAGPLPRSIDVKKIYLHVYPFVGDVKPAARRDLLNEWSEGSLIVNFDGHGSPLQWADERVMVNTDVYSLTNANRRPLVMSFSCDVGDLESPYHRSMGQNMVTFDQGGAIAAIAADAPTYNFPNSLLNNGILRTLFTSKDSTGTEPVGYALEVAKMSVVSGGYESNNSKYILIGDPALKLAMPAYKLTHETAAVDTMLTGHTYRVNGAVRVGGSIDASFNGSTDVVVQEAEQKVHEVIIIVLPPRDTMPPDTIRYTLDYVLPGRELFRGSVDVVQGRFQAAFVVPLRCRTGFGARIRSYATSQSRDAVGAVDTLRIMLADTLQANSGSPSINLYFAGQATKVKQGAKLIAEISDPDGIAILGADPQSSIFLEFDGSGFPVYVTDFFTYDHGSWTKGRVEYPLQPGMAPGPHTVMLRAFDNLGASTSDTLHFEIVEEGLYTVSDVFNFPNPFSNVTNFVFQVTSPAEATLSMYTVSGIKIWHTKIAAAEGFNSIVWDGRDTAGDRLANGTYLYVLDVEFPGSYHREDTVKGKAVLLR